MQDRSQKIKSDVKNTVPLALIFQQTKKKSVLFSSFMLEAADLTFRLF